MSTKDASDIQDRLVVFCNTLTEALGAEPLAPDEHDLDVLAEAILTRFKDYENSIKEQEEKLSRVLNIILEPFGKRYRSAPIEDIGSKVKVEGEAIVLAEVPGSIEALVEEVMRQHVKAFTDLRRTSADLLTNLIVYATPIAGSPVDVAARKLNGLVKPRRTVNPAAPPKSAPVAEKLPCLDPVHCGHSGVCENCIKNGAR